MRPNDKTAAILIGLAALFIALEMAFRRDLWGHPTARPEIPLVDPAFTNTATVRVSTAELRRTGGDTSGVECYTCHERKKIPELHFETNGAIRLPKEHSDLIMQHGARSRNNACFNCHAQTNLEVLLTRDGTLLPIDESSRLCGSCHGPTLRDWELGVHGRLNGYWDRRLGPSRRQDCVSCHDPHNPAFPSRPPAPAPHRLHPEPLEAKATEPKH